jgi:glutamine amidotransferase
VAPGERAYFVHSFAAVPADSAVRLAEVDYGGHRLCAAVHQDNLYGCQFHPERSAHAGLAMLQRFLAP